MEKFYKVCINNNCSKCGMCSIENPDLFVENDNGDISISKSIITAGEFEFVSNIQSICVSNAIEIMPINDNDDYLKEILRLINEEFFTIQLVGLDEIDVSYQEKEVEFPIKFNKITSGYTYKTDDKAESDGIYQMKKLYNNHIDAIISSVVEDYKYRKILPLIDRDNVNYVFGDFEAKVNYVINSINSLLEVGFGKSTSISEFKINLEKLRNFNDLKNFNPIVCRGIDNDDLRLYVSINYNMSCDKYNYELLPDDINQVFHNVLYHNHIDEIVKSYMKDYYSAYRNEYSIFINNYKQTVLSLLPKEYNQNFKFDINSLINDVKKLNIEFMNLYKKIETTQNFDTSYDSSSRFTSYGSASDAGYNRTSRMERDFERSFDNLAEKLSEAYTADILKNIENYLRKLQMICLKQNFELNNKRVLLNVGDNTLSIDLNNLDVSTGVNTSRDGSIHTSILSYSFSNEKILKMYLEKKYKDMIYNVSPYISIDYDVEDYEEFVGYGLFDRIKTRTKYNYRINRSYVWEKQSEKQKKYCEIVYSSNINSDIYKQFCKKVLEVISQ